MNKEAILEEFDALFTDTILPINPKLKRLFKQYVNSLPEIDESGIAKRKVEEYIKERYKVEPFHIAVHQLFVWLDSREKQ